MEKYMISDCLTPVFQTPGKAPEWGGYYNYDLLSSDHTRLLCHKTNFEGRGIQQGDTVMIGWYDIPGSQWHEIDVSDSFNWQQGSMLQWLPGSNDSKVIFNISKGGRIISRIADINTGEKRDLCYPVYGITPDGKTSITLNFERSYWCIAYHYQSVANEEYNVDIPENDGIFSLDIEKNHLSRIISLQDVLKLDPDPDFEKGKHWLEHIMINREGTKFVFLHRFCYNHTGRLTRMIIADIDGSNMQVVDGWRDYSWSHFGWINETDFVIYSTSKTGAAKIYNKIDSSGEIQNNKKIKARNLIVKAYRFLKPLVPAFLCRKMSHKNEYQFYSLENGRYKMTDRMGGRLLDIDGHPSFAFGGKYMITDSYPDEKKYRRLIICNLKNKKQMRAGYFFAGLKGTPAACDLHPKLSHDGTMLAVDTAYSGVHRMMVLKINWEKVQKKIG